MTRANDAEPSHGGRTVKKANKDHPLHLASALHPSGTNFSPAIPVATRTVLAASCMTPKYNEVLVTPHVSPVDLSAGSAGACVGTAPNYGQTRVAAHT